VVGQIHEFCGSRSGQKKNYSPNYHISSSTSSRHGFKEESLTFRLYILTHVVQMHILLVCGAQHTMDCWDMAVSFTEKLGVQCVSVLKYMSPLNITRSTGDILSIVSTVLSRHYLILIYLKGAI